MDKPATVLAALEDAAHALNHTSTAPERLALLEATEVVRELIDAAKAARQPIEALYISRLSYERQVAEETEAREARLDAAIAKATGASA